MAKDELGVRIGDELSFTVIGTRKNGSFRAAMRKYGFTPAQIKRVLPDIDCDRDVVIQSGSHRFELRAF